MVHPLFYCNEKAGGAGDYNISISIIRVIREIRISPAGKTTMIDTTKKPNGSLQVIWLSFV
jgi:hypothetical protein